MNKDNHIHSVRDIKRPRRFLRRYLRGQDQDRPWYSRALRITAGSVLILLGIAIGWLPGPGFVLFALPGSYILAGESKRLAVYLDRFEEWGRGKWREVQGKNAQ